MAGLAAQVQALLPDRRVASATLAEPGALAAAVGALGAQGLAYPLFMAGGWFTRSHLPKRLAEAGGQGWRVLEPLGTDPALHALAVTLAREAGAGAVLLAAHGSGRSEAPSAVAREVAARIAGELGLRAEATFIDQSPRIAETSGWDEGAICLPFFAAGGGHVSADIPAQLAEAGFQGRLLAPLGQDARVPALIAEAVRRA